MIRLNSLGTYELFANFQVGLRIRSRMSPEKGTKEALSSVYLQKSTHKTEFRCALTFPPLWATYRENRKTEAKRKSSANIVPGVASGNRQLVL